MGQVSLKLHAKLKKRAGSLALSTREARARGDVPSVEAFISQGLDPVHAAYAFAQNITSYFAEVVSQLPEMKVYAKLAGEAEEEYMPSGPPMSPLTRSFFTTWAFYELRIGDDDTLGTCLIDANDVVGMNPEQLEALKGLAQSRMGIYEHGGMEGGLIRLKELITNDEFTCLCTSGYKGRRGELWYVRLLPPLVPDLASYHIVFTTPYILIGATKSDWVNYLRRALVQFEAADDRKSLHVMLKYGTDPNFWNEFVFKAYHHHQSDAIFLTGIPDLKSTLPHA
jgi:hypothetical protein